MGERRRFTVSQRAKKKSENSVKGLKRKKFKTGGNVWYFFKKKIFFSLSLKMSLWWVSSGVGSVHLQPTPSYRDETGKVMRAVQPGGVFLFQK